jgi:hypothetical protein
MDTPPHHANTSQLYSVPAILILLRIARANLFLNCRENLARAPAPAAAPGLPEAPAADQEVLLVPCRRTLAVAMTRQLIWLFCCRNHQEGGRMKRRVNFNPPSDRTSRP